MLARFVLGAFTAGVVIAPAIAGMMSADEARKFVAGKVFAFSCFDGTRGAGRILDDMGAAGAVQFNGSGPARAEISARVETPGVESSEIAPVKSEVPKSESAPELRRSTD